MTCPDCGGEGFVMVCCDDLCIGHGECIHGDGEAVCSTCGGEGEMDGDLYGEWIGDFEEGNLTTKTD